MINEGITSFLVDLPQVATPAWVVLLLHVETFQAPQNVKMSMRREDERLENQTFAVDLSVLLRLSGGLQALATLCASEAVLVPGLWKGGGETGKGPFRHGLVFHHIIGIQMNVNRGGDLMPFFVANPRNPTPLMMLLRFVFFRYHQSGATCDLCSHGNKQIPPPLFISRLRQGCKSRLMQ